MPAPSRLLLAAAALAAAARVAAAPLAWTKHSLPLSGELVLTDVHAIADGDRVVALASGEAGVLLKLDAPAAQAKGVWTTLLDTSFPTYWYGAYAFSATSYLVSGFIDGDGAAYGVVAFSDDAGRSWGNDTKIDPCGGTVCAWGGGPIEFANATEGYMPSTSGQSAWRTQQGGRNASEWTEIVPGAGQWHAGNYIYDRSGLIRIAGSDDCTSIDFGVTWACRDAWDSSGMDSALSVAGTHGLVGGGEISPDVLGWVHVSTDGGKTFAAERALAAAFPIRSVQVVPSSAAGAGSIMIAAGGNFFSACGGIYSSVDLGKTWTLDIDLGQEVKACRSLALPAINVTRVFCVSAGQSGGSIVSADIPM
jgi:hypothetical protein